MKFTQSNVRTLKCPDGKSDYTQWDEAMAGFGIRFRNGGGGTYIILYSVLGRQTRLPLGRVSQVTLIEAQTEAKQAFALIAKHTDPMKERAKAAAKCANKFGDKVAIYIARLKTLGLSPGYIADHERNLQRYMVDLHRYGFSEITRAQIATQLDKIEAKNGRRQAGLARAQVSGFFGWAKQKGWIEINPAEGTEKRNSRRRARVLTPAELTAIWNGTDSDSDFDQIVRLLILTAARKTQIGSLNRKTELKLADRLCDFEPPHVRQERGEDDGCSRHSTSDHRAALRCLMRQALSTVVDNRLGGGFASLTFGRWY